MDDAVARALAEARALGFLGPGPLTTHERSAEAFIEAIGPVPDETQGLDLGSGGGVPGLLLAAHYADVEWTLLDVHRRRTSFLVRAVAELGWGGRVRVVRAQAEHVAHDPAFRGRYGLVVSRSFGPPPVTAECAAGFLAVGGRLLVAEPPTDSPVRWDAAALRTMGLEFERGGAVAVLRAASPPPPEVPRPWRTMERSPAW